MGPGFVSENVRLYEHWKADHKFQDRYLQELVREAAILDLDGLCAAAKSENEAASIVESRAMFWLEDYVVDDLAGHLSAEMAWQLLWDEARKLPKVEIEELHGEYGKKSVKDSV